LSIKELPIDQQREIQKGRLYALKVKRALGDDLSKLIAVTPVEEVKPIMPKDGKDGQEGPMGPMGPVGPQGVPGRDGKDGRDGRDGKDGEEGPQGPRGEQGPAGADGQDGKEPVVEFAEGKDFDRLKINGVVKGPHLTGPAGKEGTTGQVVGFYGGGGGGGVAQVNSDWNATSGVEEILNKPAIPSKTSDLTNDSGYITGADVPTNETDPLSLHLDQTTEQTLINGIPLLESTRVIDDVHHLVDKMYVDIAFSNIGINCYLTDDASGVGTYKLNSITAPTTGGEKTATVTQNADGDHLVGGWVQPGAGPKSIAAGSYILTSQAKRGADSPATQRTVRLYFELWEFNADGSDSQLLKKSSLSDEITATRRNVIISGALPATVDIAAGKYCGIKIYANYSGGNKETTLEYYYGQGTNTHVASPANKEVLDAVYVPYTGATQNIDLGSKNLTTTGDITADSIQLYGVANVGSSTDSADLYINNGGGLWVYNTGNANVVGAVCKTGAAEWQFNDDVNIGSTGDSENLRVYGDVTADSYNGDGSKLTGIESFNLIQMQVFS
jgi:hypothetical protein